MNSKNNHKKDECEILVCLDEYNYDNVNNNEDTWWLGYKY